MTPEEQERLQAAVKEIAVILYKNTSPSELQTLEGIANAGIRQSQNCLFFIEETTGTNKGRQSAWGMDMMVCGNYLVKLAVHQLAWRSLIGIICEKIFTKLVALLSDKSLQKTSYGLVKLA